MLLNSKILNTVRKRIDDSKKIPNYSNYVILPNEGLVYSLKRNRFIGSKNLDGYWQCTLYANNGEICHTGIYRIIYTACYGEIPEGLQVNHIDENKSNNCISNLNLMTPKENSNYGTRNERVAKANINGKCSKAVGAYKNGILQFTFSSTREAERQLGFDSGAISKCCRGIHYNTYKGYEWQYIETEKVSI